MAQQANKEQLHELLYQALETELGGEKVYETALRCALDESLKEEWGKYHKETRTHQAVLRQVLGDLGLDPDAKTPGREVVAHLGSSLVKAMDMAQNSGNKEAAQLVAGECVVLAETKDHMNWELIKLASEKIQGKERDILAKASQKVEHEEDHHLYHSRGFTRELWLKGLGFPAVLPPPEETKHVASAIGASRAEHSRDQML
jgi:rubrerythrin